jgi:diketogulonate reductase-like aldo/keto reductase
MHDQHTSPSPGAIAQVPRIRLNHGVEMPALGLGVYRSPPELTADAVASAIAQGYRLIDTASVYRNERQVGEGIARSGVERGELFVTTKLWITDYGYERALRAFDASRRRLGLDYIDLYLLHWPMPRDFSATVSAYRAIQRLLSDGRVRAIGVSNFSESHLEDLIVRTDVVPAVNQVELHPFFIQRETREADARHGVVTQSWSPLGGVNVYAPRDPRAVRDPLTHPVITALAQKHHRTQAQVVLRWHLEHGLSVIPKSVRPDRIAENIGVFDFRLDEDEVAAIDALDTGERGGLDPEIVDTRLFTSVVTD